MVFSLYNHFYIFFFALFLHYRTNSGQKYPPRRFILLCSTLEYPPYIYFYLLLEIWLPSVFIRVCWRCGLLFVRVRVRFVRQFLPILLHTLWYALLCLLWQPFARVRKCYFILLRLGHVVSVRSVCHDVTNVFDVIIITNVTAVGMVHINSIVQLKKVNILGKINLSDCVGAIFRLCPRQLNSR